MLGSPSVRIPSLSGKWRTLKLEMYPEAFLLWNININSPFAQGSNCSARRARPTLAIMNIATLGLFLSHSAKMRVAGLWTFQPRTTYKQLSCSSCPGLHCVVSKGRVLAAGLQGNLKNTSWNHFYESFTENTFTDEKHI